MIYRDFRGEKLSLLGFGAMRLPTLGDGSIDQEQTNKMIDYALEHGVNYVDTAFPYHNSMSEIAVGKALSRHPRDSYNLATKFPGHTIASSYDPEGVFELQLRKCQVDYFDFYLMHNVYENSIKTYLDPKWGIMDYFIEQKKKGRIRHLGFSCHGDIPVIEEFIGRYGDELEFCQIQLNYLDWTLQNAKGKYETLEKLGYPVWVMEPVRGGKLADLPRKDKKKLESMRSGASEASFSFRFLQRLPNLRMILSGMSTLDQVVDNCRTFEKPDPLSDGECEVMLEIAEDLKDSIPCTGCRYCCKGCPMELDIPFLISKYNQLRAGNAMTVKMQMESMPEDRLPSACIACGQCAAVCPQKIDVPEELAGMAKMLSEMPTWEEISKQRNRELDQQMEELGDRK